MQNVDFYSGKTLRDIPPQFSREDPEYFARLAKVHTKDEHKSMKRASRMLSLIIALCIISFTAGLVVGIKFASGSSKQIMDQQTREAVTNIGQKVSDFVKENPEANGNVNITEKKLFAREDFPYVIRIGKQYNKSQSQEIAGIISSHGDTVILSRDGGNYKIFAGPYRNYEEAMTSLSKIKTYSTNINAVIIKR
jgi:hypothetical protein